MKRGAVKNLQQLLFLFSAVLIWLSVQAQIFKNYDILIFVRDKIKKIFFKNRKRKTFHENNT